MGVACLCSLETQQRGIEQFFSQDDCTCESSCVQECLLWFVEQRFLSYRMFQALQLLSLVSTMAFDSHSTRPGEDNSILFGEVTLRFST